MRAAARGHAPLAADAGAGVIGDDQPQPLELPQFLQDGPLARAVPGVDCQVYPPGVPVHGSFGDDRQEPGLAVRDHSAAHSGRPGTGSDRDVRGLPLGSPASTSECSLRASSRTWARLRVSSHLAAASIASTARQSQRATSASLPACTEGKSIPSEIIAGQRQNVPAMYPLRSSPPRASSNFLAALVRRLERVRAPRANRARGRSKTGIHLGPGVLNRC